MGPMHAKIFFFFFFPYLLSLASLLAHLFSWLYLTGLRHMDCARTAHPQVRALAGAREVRWGACCVLVGGEWSGQGARARARGWQTNPLRVAAGLVHACMARVHSRNGPAGLNRPKTRYSGHQKSRLSRNAT